MTARTSPHVESPSRPARLRRLLEDSDRLLVLIDASTDPREFVPWMNQWHLIAKTLLEDFGVNVYTDENPTSLG